MYLIPAISRYRWFRYSCDPDISNIVGSCNEANDFGLFNVLQGDDVDGHLFVVDHVAVEHMGMMYISILFYVLRIVGTRYVSK